MGTAVIYRSVFDERNASQRWDDINKMYIKKCDSYKIETVNDDGEKGEYVFYISETEKGEYVSATILHKIAALQNKGYNVLFVF